MTESKSDRPDIALEERHVDEARLFSPSAARNRDVIADALGILLPKDARVLEIGSGTGEHAVHVTSKRPDISWVPSDPDTESRQSVAAWIQHENTKRIASPLDLNMMDGKWFSSLDDVNAIVSMNMIHIAPFEACEGLFEGAGHILPAQGQLILYGPFSSLGEHIADSNASFDQSLKSRNPAWGVRDIENDLLPLAKSTGFKLSQRLSMPANNLVLEFQKI